MNLVGGYPAFGSGLPFTVIGGGGPLLGGVIMSYVTYRPSGVTDLWDRVTDLSRIPLRWGVITVAFFPLLALITGTIALLTTDATFVLDVGELRTLLGDPSAFVIAVLVIVIVGPLPEEIGWRGVPP